MRCLMLRRYDLCEDAVERMWGMLLEMNECGSRASLLREIIEQHPNLDQEKVKELIFAIWMADN